MTTYAAVQRQAEYECKVFQFKDEVLPDQRCVISAPAPSNKYDNTQPGCEFFQVYWWLRGKYEIL